MNEENIKKSEEKQPDDESPKPKQKRRPTVHVDKRFISPISGFEEDIHKILHEFIKCKSLRFCDFSEIWRQMNFSCIHAGRMGNSEKREFVEETFKVVLRFALFPYSFQIRVGAIYLLYSIFKTQKCDPPVLVRTTVSNWQELEALHLDLIRSSHTDASYIFRKMIYVDQMFTIVAYNMHTDREEMYIDESDDESRPCEEEEHNNGLDDCFQKAHGNSLTNVVDLYQSKKIHDCYLKVKNQILQKKKNHEVDDSLKLVDADVFDTIVSLDVTAAHQTASILGDDNSTHTSFKAFDSSKLSEMAKYQVVEPESNYSEEQATELLESMVLPHLKSWCNYSKYSLNVEDYNAITSHPTTTPPLRSLSIASNKSNGKSISVSRKAFAGSEISDTDSNFDLEEVPPTRKKSTRRKKRVFSYEQLSEDSSLDCSDLDSTYSCSSGKKRSSAHLNKTGVSSNKRQCTDALTASYDKESSPILQDNTPTAEKALSKVSITHLKGCDFEKIRPGELLALQGVGPDTSLRPILGVVHQMKEKEAYVELYKSSKGFQGKQHPTGEMHWVNESNIVYANSMELNKTGVVPMFLRRIIKEYYKQYDTEKF